MDVSVIIVNYKTPHLVVECVKSIEELTKDVEYEIIVVDNCSNDSSSDILKKELKDKIKLIESDVNLGFGKANNLGNQYASGKYIFLLNSDTVLINNAIKILFDYLENNNTVGIVGGNLYSRDLKENGSFCLEFDSIESLKKQTNWVNIFSEIFGRRFRKLFYNEEKLIKYHYRDKFNYSLNPIEVAYVFGADMMMPRDLFNKVNGFDRDFFMYAEEEDLCWRIHKEGYKIMSVPQSKIIHLDGASFISDDSFNFKQYCMRLNGAMMYYFKRYGEFGCNSFYEYRKLGLIRRSKVSKLFKREKSLEIYKLQLNCLEEQYRLFKQANC